MAFTPARYAVIGEGIADAVLLPTLLRQALGDGPAYQVVSGLAELEQDAILSLDKEASAVAYLVDGDDGGRAIMKKITSVGISKDRIVILGGDSRSGVVPEDLVSRAAYAAAVNAELHRSYGSDTTWPESVVPDRSRPLALLSWCKQQGLTPPNRAAVAAQVVEAARRNTVIAPAHRATLRRTHAKLAAILGLTST